MTKRFGAVRRRPRKRDGLKANPCSDLGSPVCQSRCDDPGTRWRRGDRAVRRAEIRASYWEKVAAEAPPDWTRKNLQIVLKVRVVNNTAKPPDVVATHFW